MTAGLVEAKEMVEDSLVADPDGVAAAVDGPALRSITARRRAADIISKLMTKARVVTMDGMACALKIYARRPTLQSGRRRRPRLSGRPGRRWRLEEGDVGYRQSMLTGGSASTGEDGPEAADDGGGAHIVLKIVKHYAITS